jgi:uncharacterized protein (TIGR02118 family)
MSIGVRPRSASVPELRNGTESVPYSAFEFPDTVKMQCPESVSTRRASVNHEACELECMMVRLLVLYGHPEDPEAFDRHYEEIHIPLAKRMQGLKKWTIGKVVGTPGGEPSEYYYVADLYADSREELEAILATPEGQAAVGDVPNYASGGVTFLYTEVQDVI